MSEDTGDETEEPTEEDEVRSLFTGVEEAEDEVPYDSVFNPVERPRGILSPTDREYLCGLKDYSHSQTELNRRQSIRERTIEAIRDFNLLLILLEGTERDKIIEAFEAEELNTAFWSMIAFMYIGIDQDVSRMEELLERGIYFGANYKLSGRWSGKANDVSVEIDIEYEPNLESLYERVEEGEGNQLTPAEIGSLVKAGKLNPQDLAELEDSGPDFPSVYAGGSVESAREEEDDETSQSD